MFSTHCHIKCHKIDYLWFTMVKQLELSVFEMGKWSQVAKAFSHIRTRVRSTPWTKSVIIQIQMPLKRKRNLIHTEHFRNFLVRMQFQIRFMDSNITLLGSLYILCNLNFVFWSVESSQNWRQLHFSLSLSRKCAAQKCFEKGMNGDTNWCSNQVEHCGQTSPDIKL